MGRQTGSRELLSVGKYRRALARLAAFAEEYVPESARHDTESLRRARMIGRFGFLGFIFGMVYALVFILVHHYWGSAIISVCSFGFLATPFLLKKSGKLNFYGHVLSFILTVGFTGLCLVEGGMEGHAIAWLASVPLCTLLVVGRRAATGWVITCFILSAAVIAAGAAGVHFPRTYPEEWESIISAMGYLGLIPFMFFLGMIFELSRERAFEKLLNALRELEASNDQLIALNQEKNEFMGIAAHDLKNPLMIILWNAEMLKLTKNPEKLDQMADTIHLTVKRMRDLIQNLLDVNAIEQGQFNYQIETCNILDLLERSLQGNRQAAQRKGIQVNLNDHATYFVKADANAALQVLDNLISNAIKYSPHGKQVDISVRLEGKQVVVAVKDQGPGLSEEDQKRLFHKFTRLTAKPTGGESSTGLGLSIVKRLIEGMHGTVECHSTLGAGATFSIKLPEAD